MLGIVFALAPAPLYSFYAEAPRLWGISALTDEQYGGVIMLGVGNIVYFIAIIVVFMRLFSDPGLERGAGGGSDRRGAPVSDEAYPRTHPLRFPRTCTSTHLRTLAAGLGVCVAIGIFACGNGTTPPGGTGPAACNGTAAASSLGLNLHDDRRHRQPRLRPGASNAAVGDVIEFNNTGTVPHTVTFQDNNDGCLTDCTLAPGQPGRSSSPSRARTTISAPSMPPT